MTASSAMPANAGLPASTRFTELVGCWLPLQQAGMSRVATPELAAAVSNAGALGMLAIGRLAMPVVEDMVDAVLARTEHPVGCTFIVKFLDPAVLAYVAGRLPVIEHFWGWPDAALVPDGTIVGWQVGSVDEAKAAVDAGCRYVIAQGIEAGGHVRGLVPLDELVPAVRDAVGDQIALVAAGGIVSAADVRAALAAGADAVRVGTRFLAAAEADVHPAYLDALVAADAADTVLTLTFDVGWPDAPHRVLASAETAALTEGPDPVGELALADGTVSPLRRRGTTPPTRTTTGEIGAMALYAGTGVGAVKAPTTAAAIVAELTGP